MKNIKNKIRELREDMDLRQIDVAKATGIDQKTLSNYETGKTNPDSYAIIRLADFFRVSTDYLLGCSNINITTSDDVIEKLETIEETIHELRNILNKQKKQPSRIN